MAWSDERVMNINIKADDFKYVTSDGIIDGRITKNQTPTHETWPCVFLNSIDETNTALHLS